MFENLPTWAQAALPFLLFLSIMGLAALPRMFVRAPRRRSRRYY